MTANPLISSEIKEKVSVRDFWYVACKSDELKGKSPKSVEILNEWVVLFRNEEGKACAMRDRCMHRNIQLSLGKVEKGCLRCPYHGWLYDGEGKVREVPAQKKCPSLKNRTFPVKEQDGFIFVCLSKTPLLEEPYRSPYYGQKGWRSQRLINRFNNDVTNCAENFIDVPHTVFVHPGIFRASRDQHIEVKVTRKDGEVRVDYENETNNIGFFSRFLNPGNNKIVHVDHFYMPNFTSVEYHFGKNRHFYISSHSIPVNDEETLVYTDLTYNFGIWTPLAGPFVRMIGQKVIDQDLVVLEEQMKCIKKYGRDFHNVAPDIVHIFIEQIQDEIARGRDPRRLKPAEKKFEMWI